MNPALFELILKFRLYKIAMTSDIEKAYLQIRVREEDRHFMRFLWYSDVFTESPTNEKFQFCRVMFGLAPSQYLLNLVVRKHGTKYKKIDPEFPRKVGKHFYVDDLRTGVSGRECLMSKKGWSCIRNLKFDLWKGGFNIKKWRTNDTGLRELVEEKDRNQEKKAKVLGIVCNDPHDTLQLGVKKIFKDAEKLEPTKRNVLTKNSIGI